MRIGLLGGTYDPVHIAHLRLAEEAMDRFELDRVELVLSADPPHKPGPEVTPARVRWEMLCAAAQGNDRLVPSAVEINRPGPSYTIETILEKRAEIGESDDIYLLIGMDCAKEIQTWKSYERVLELVTVIVATRKGESPASIPDRIARSFQFFEMTGLEISSTRIRELAREGKSLRYLVPDSALEILQREGLYQTPMTSAALEDPR